MQCFHHKDFSDIGRLRDLKQAAGERITVCIPTLNEAETIGAIVRTIRRDLVEHVPLVDEILVVDSGSADATAEIAAAEGAVVFESAAIAPESGTHAGKGENLWKALHVARGSIVCFIDGDIMRFHSGFVSGLLGPMLEDGEIDYVKAFYERPLAFGDAPHATGGGRVSEILVRPLISLFYPGLAEFLQPLAGEYAARRELLESLSFPVGYGVEIAHLIDLARDGRLDRIAQVDLEKRIHRNRDDGDLGDAAFAILRVILRRLERDGRITLAAELPEIHQRWLIDENGIERITRHLPEPERPPLAGMQNGSPVQSHGRQ